MGTVSSSFDRNPVLEVLDSFKAVEGMSSLRRFRGSLLTKSLCYGILPVKLAPPTSSSADSDGAAVDSRTISSGSTAMILG